MDPITEHRKAIECARRIRLTGKGHPDGKGAIVRSRTESAAVCLAGARQWRLTYIRNA